MSYSEPSNGIRYATKRIPKKLPALAVAVGVGKDEAVSQKVIVVLTRQKARSGLWSTLPTHKI